VNVPDLPTKPNELREAVRLAAKRAPTAHKTAQFPQRGGVEFVHPVGELPPLRPCRDRHTMFFTFRGSKMDPRIVELDELEVATISARRRVIHDFADDHPRAPTRTAPEVLRCAFHVPVMKLVVDPTFSELCGGGHV